MCLGRLLTAVATSQRLSTIQLPTIAPMARLVSEPMHVFFGIRTGTLEPGAGLFGRNLNQS
jgi:hypothetical protein